MSKNNAFILFIIPEYNGICFLVHAVYDRKGLQTDPLGTDQISAYLEALFDYNTGSYQLGSGISYQCDQSLQRLAIARKSSIIRTLSPFPKNSFATMISYTLPWVKDSTLVV